MSHYELQASRHYEAVKSPHWEFNRAIEKQGKCSVVGSFHSPHFWRWFEMQREDAFQGPQYQNLLLTCNDGNGHSKEVMVTRNRYNGSGGDPLSGTPAAYPDELDVAVYFGYLQQFGVASDDGLTLTWDGGDGRRATAVLSGEISLQDCKDIARSLLGMVDLPSLTPGLHKSVEYKVAAGGYSMFTVPTMYPDENYDYWWMWGNGGIVWADMHAAPWANSSEEIQITTPGLVLFEMDQPLKPVSGYWCGSNYTNSFDLLTGQRIWMYTKSKWQPVSTPVYCTDNYAAASITGKTAWQVSPQYHYVNPTGRKLLLDPTLPANAALDLAADATYNTYSATRWPNGLRDL